MTSDPFCRRRVVDAFLFFNELDLLELRLKTLADWVDVFVITECHETFSGQKKPMVFADNMERFGQYLGKIVYNPVGAAELEALQRPEWRDYRTDLDICVGHKHGGRPARNLRSSLRREVCHRDAVVLGVRKAACEGDVILLSDADEIPDPRAVAAVARTGLPGPSYFRMKWFLYWINNQADRDWYGTVAFEWQHLRGRSMDLLRYASHEPSGVPGPVVQAGGWHFSYLGGSEAIAAKLAALPYQGRRAQVAALLNRMFPGRVARMLRRNGDILLKGRRFSRVELDDSFPSGLLASPELGSRYLAPLNL